MMGVMLLHATWLLAAQCGVQTEAILGVQCGSA